MEIEVISAAALREAAGLADDPVARLSPTVFIRNHPRRFPSAAMPMPSRDLSACNWRVKTPDDLAFAKGVYDALHDADPAFGMDEVLDLVESRRAPARFAA